MDKNKKNLSVAYRFLRALGLNYSEEEYGQVSLWKVIKRVSKTYRDGFGMSVIEASAMSVPVIASSLTGSKETLEDGFTGFHTIVTPDDISDKIERLFNISLQKELGDNGRNWVVENFDHTKVWPYIIEVINK